MVQAANAALMERTPFAIDDAGSDDDDTDEDSEDEEDDDQVLDEVRSVLLLIPQLRLSIRCDQVDAFLEENDSGLTDADKKVANG